MAADLNLTCRHCLAALTVDTDELGLMAWVDDRNSDLCATDDYQLHHPLPSSDKWQTQSPVRAGHWIECREVMRDCWVVFERVVGQPERWVAKFSARMFAEEAVVALAAERLEALAVTA